MPFNSLQTFALKVAIPALIGLWGASAAPPLAAQSLDSQISQLLSAGQIEAAEELLARSLDAGGDKQFFEARVLKAQGRLPEAISLLRETLRLYPDHLNARRELAHTLLLNGEFRAAEHHFETLLDVDQNTQMRRGYHQFLTTIHQNKPVGVSGRLAFLPSTNVNRGTTNTIFDTSLGQFAIDPNSQATSGVGVELGVSGYFRKIPDPSQRVTLQWDLAGIRYEESRYNKASASLALIYEKLTATGDWSLAPFYRYTWRADDADNTALGLRLHHRTRIGARTQLRLSASHERRWYPSQSYQNGSISTASVSLSYQVAPSLGLTAGLGFERGTPDADHLKYDHQRIFASATKLWQGGLRGSLGVDLGKRDFVGIYPLTSEARDDSYYKVQFGLSHSQIDIMGFRPTLNCSHTLNRSNVSFYDYGATECQATLNRNF